VTDTLDLWLRIGLDYIGMHPSNGSNHQELRRQYLTISASQVPSRSGEALNVAEYIRLCRYSMIADTVRILMLLDR
jgi:hypothetical protein